MSHTILLVDADESTTAFLADQLAADGYQAVVARTLDAVFALADTTAPDVVVLGDLAERRHALGLLDDVRAGARPFDPDVLVLVLSAHAATHWTCCGPSTTVPTTSWPSRPATRSCAPASRRSCAAGARAGARSCACATSRSTPARAWSGWPGSRSR